MGAQTLTARTVCKDEGISKPAPPHLQARDRQAERAGRGPTVGRRRQGSEPHGRDPARGAGRGAQPAEPDGGTPGRYIKIGTLQLRHPTAPNTSHPDLFAYPMTTAARANTTSWTFRTRFRRGAFGWKGTQLAIGRINEALTEIRAVARHDPARAAEGAVLLLEKLSPALCQIDSSSGALGNATFATVQELAPLISQAPVSTKVRQQWLDRLFEAIQEDDPPYIESLGDHWGDLCATRPLGQDRHDVVEHLRHRDPFRRHEHQLFKH